MGHLKERLVDLLFPLLFKKNLVEIVADDGNGIEHLLEGVFRIDLFNLIFIRLHLPVDAADMPQQLIDIMRRTITGRRLVCVFRREICPRAPVPPDESQGVIKTFNNMDFKGNEWPKDADGGLHDIIQSIKNKHAERAIPVEGLDHLQILLPGFATAPGQLVAVHHQVIGIAPQIPGADSLLMLGEHLLKAIGPQFPFRLDMVDISLQK